MKTYAKEPKKIIILPGWQDTPKLKPYQRLAQKAQEKGYAVELINIDWKKTLSSQVFPVSSNATIFGFSLGAILAWLVAQKNPCQHLILASMTPHYSFNNQAIKKSLIDLIGEDSVNDIINNLTSSHQAQKQTILYGDLENEPADIIVQNTDHELTSNYIDEVVSIL